MIKRKKYNMEPKQKIKKVFARVVKGETMKSAVIAEYKDKTNQTQVRKSRSWQVLLQRTIPDSKLTKVLDKGLSATKMQGVGGMVLNTEKREFGHTDIEVPDYAVRHKYLETGLKLKDRFPKEGLGTAIQINLNRFRKYE